MTSTINLPFKAKTETFITLSDYEFEQFINKYYNVKDFSVCADVESGNDTDHSFNVTKEELHDWDRDRLNKFKETGNGSYLTHTLLQDLVNEDIIPEGKYLIRVSW